MNNGNIHPLPQADIESLKDYFPEEHWDDFFWGFTCHSRQEYAGIVQRDNAGVLLTGVRRHCPAGRC